MLKQILRGYYLWRSLGVGWLWFRITYAVRRRLGFLRRATPTSTWEKQPLEQWLIQPALADPVAYLHYRRSEKSPRFFFAHTDRTIYAPYFSQWDSSDTSPLKISNELSQGVLCYFEETMVSVGFPPRWNRNPFSGQESPLDKHWSEISDFDSGDIKIIWEPSRFGFVYALVRAYWRTGDQQYPEIFWQLVEDWRQNNLPNVGANWKCGQETTFRVMALCFGLYGFLDAETTTPQRVIDLAQLVAVSAQRISANLAFALSQRNNHGISEGVGLWTIGLLFPELHQASRWAEMGQKVLEQLGQELIYADGSFSQHSVNYHRLMLHDYLWAIRLGDLNGQSVSDELRKKIAMAGDFLYQVQDEQTGQVPNYGQNDGALVLPLSNCDFSDFRPVIQAIQMLVSAKRRYQTGAWDEDLLWLFGPSALNRPLESVPRIDWQASQGGYFTFRSSNGFVFTRCASFHDRPSQADMLHVDLWWKGQNIARDAGTYSYNAAEPWNNRLIRTKFHNTVGVDGLDQMEQAGKFLWLPWLRSAVRHQQSSPTGKLCYWEGEHDGYQRLSSPVRHHRGIMRIGEETWVVVDRLYSEAIHEYRLHWLLLDCPSTWDPETNHLQMATPSGEYHVYLLALGSLAQTKTEVSMMRADAHSPRGWYSPTYLHRLPALSIEHVMHTAQVTFLTVFSPKAFLVQMDTVLLQLTSETEQARVEFSSGAVPTLVTHIALQTDSENVLALV